MDLQGHAKVRCEITQKSLRQGKHVANTNGGRRWWFLTRRSTAVRSRQRLPRASDSSHHVTVPLASLEEGGPAPQGVSSLTRPSCRSRERWEERRRSSGSYRRLGKPSVRIAGPRRILDCGEAKIRTDGGTSGCPSPQVLRGSRVLWRSSGPSCRHPCRRCGYRHRLDPNPSNGRSFLVHSGWSACAPKL